MTRGLTPEAYGNKVMLNMHRPLIIGLSVFITGTLVGLGCLFLPTPEGEAWVAFNVGLAISMAMAIYFGGAAVLFARGLKGFSGKLRSALRLISIGIVLFGVAQVYIPLATLVGAQNTLVGLSVGPFAFTAAILTLFAGIRKLAKLFDIHNRWLSWRWALGVFVVLATIVSVLPHAPVAGGEMEFRVANVMLFFMATLLFFASMQVLHIKKYASASYTNTLAWLWCALVIILSDGLVFFTFTMFVGDPEWYVLYANIFVVHVPFAIASLCMLRSSYSFNFITAAPAVVSWETHGFFGRRVSQQPAKDVSAIDIVTFAAGLASDTRAIDGILDELRTVTGHIAPGQLPTIEDEKVLAQVYMSLEEYLLKEEKIRVFTRESLRKAITDGLQLQSSSSTFWQNLSAGVA